MMNRFFFVTGSLLAAFMLFVSPVEAKVNTKKLKVEVVNSIEELMQLDSVNGKHIILTAESGQVWRGGAREAIVIENGENFALDGGDNNPTIYGHPVILKNCHNVLVRNIAVRLGSAGFAGDETNAAFSVENSKKVDLENCSFTWGTSESLSISDSRDVTVSQCIVGEPLAGGAACTVQGSEDVELEECVITRSTGGTPHINLTGAYDMDLRLSDNVIFNWGDYGALLSNSSGERNKHKVEFFDNHFLADEGAGPAILVEPMVEKTKLKVKLKNNRDRNGKDIEATVVDGRKIDVKNKGLRKKIADVDKIVKAVGPKTRSATDQRIVDSILAREFQPALLSEVEVPEFALYNLSLSE